MSMNAVNLAPTMRLRLATASAIQSFRAPVIGPCCRWGER